MPLFLPNTIDRDTTADAVEVEQNFGVIQQHVNTNLINRDGSVAMINPLLLAGDPSQPNQAANKAYVDAQVSTQLNQTEADALYVNVAGDTMTGNLSGTTIGASSYMAAPRFLITEAQAAEGNAATRKDYVDAQDGAYYNSLVARMDSQDLAYYNNYTVNKVNRYGDNMNGPLRFNGDPYGGQPGAQIMDQNIAINSHTATGKNLYLFHSGAAYDTNSNYIVFAGQTGGTTLGAVLQTSSAGVAYFSSSDYRLKDDLGPVEDPVGKLMALQPKHLRWKADGVEFDGFIAHELQTVVPHAVSGVKDAVDGDGNIQPQMVDATNVVALLTAALQEALTRIEALENAA